MQLSDLKEVSEESETSTVRLKNKRDVNSFTKNDYCSDQAL